METPLEIHKRLTPLRVNTFQTLFGGKPSAVFPYYKFTNADSPCLIDVFVYPLAVKNIDENVCVAVTNGMSDFRMVDVERPNLLPRRELIQYFRVCSEVYARQLHDAAWLPHFDRFAVDVYDTISFPEPFIEDLKHSFFLRPIWSRHANFEVKIDSDIMALLWNIPLTDQELLCKQNYDINELLDRMDEAKTPWIFDPAFRYSLDTKM